MKGAIQIKFIIILIILIINNAVLMFDIHYHGIINL